MQFHVNHPALFVVVGLVIAVVVGLLDFVFFELQTVLTEMK